MDIKSADPNNETESNNWYIFKNCDKHGPLTALEIGQLLAKNQITKDHHIWHAKYNDWVAIKDVETFKNIGFDLPIVPGQDAFIEAAQPNTNAIVSVGFNESFSFWKMVKRLFS